MINCLYAAMGTAMNEPDVFERFTILAEKATKVYSRELWNGEYFNFDNSTSGHHDSVMADMLAGHWYTMLCDLPPVGKQHLEKRVVRLMC